MAESEMVEKVARALAERLPGHEKGKCLDCDYREKEAMRRARAVIEAMRPALLGILGRHVDAITLDDISGEIDAALKP